MVTLILTPTQHDSNNNNRVSGQSAEPASVSEVEVAKLETRRLMITDQLFLQDLSKPTKHVACAVIICVKGKTCHIVDMAAVDKSIPIASQGVSSTTPVTKKR